MERRYQAVDWLFLAVSALVLLLTVLNGEVRLRGLRGFYGDPMDALPAPTQFLYDVVRWPMLALATGAVITAALERFAPTVAALRGVLLGLALIVNLIWAYVWALPRTPILHAGGTASAWPNLLCGF